MTARLALPCSALLISLAVLCASPSHAQLFRRPAQVGPPPGTPPLEAEVWPFPPPDPKSWWDDKRPKPDEAADPLGGRRLRRGERLPQPDNGVDASTYRLWGLPPLQWQAVRGDEMILEVWTRPATSVRQSVVRVIVRGADAFVQGRAGLACCEAGIGRRMGFDAALPSGSANRFKALKSAPLWRSPRDVRVAEAGGAADAVCLDGTSYEITLLVPGRAATLHRACDPAEIGEAADVLEAVLGAALGHDPRFDVLFPGGASFAAARQAYSELVATGGRLKANPDARPAPPGSDPRPEVEPEPPAGEAPV